MPTRCSVMVVDKLFLCLWEISGERGAPSATFKMHCVMVDQGWSVSFSKEGATFFFFLTFIPCRLNWKVTPQEIEFDSFQNKKLKNKSCWAKNMSLIQQELNSLNLGLKSVFQHWDQFIVSTVWYPSLTTQWTTLESTKRNFRFP